MQRRWMLWHYIEFTVWFSHQRLYTGLQARICSLISQTFTLLFTWNICKRLKFYFWNQPGSIGPSVVTVTFCPFERMSACNILPTSNGSGAYTDWFASETKTWTPQATKTKWWSKKIGASTRYSFPSTCFTCCTVPLDWTAGKICSIVWGDTDS